MVKGWKRHKLNEVTCVHLLFQPRGSKKYILSQFFFQWNPFFCMVLNIFSIALHIKLGLPHLVTLGLAHCICGQPINSMTIHLMWCFHGGESTTIHYVGWDAFASIAKDVDFHVYHESTHVFSMPSPLL
jgi:hypothetical protein